MKIRFNKRKSLWALGFILAAAVAVLDVLFLPVKNELVHVAVALAALALVVAVLTKVEIRSKWMTPVLFVLLDFAAILLLHIAINGEPLSVGAFLYNMQISLAVILLLTAITGRIKLSGGIWITLCWLFGMADTLIFEFRGSQIVLNDFLSVKTALSVASNYKFALSGQILLSILLFAAIFLLLVRTPFPKAAWLRKLPGRLLMLVLVPAVLWQPVADLENHTTYTWSNRGAQKPGILYEFALELYHLNVREPDGYSPEAVQAIAEEFAAAQAVDGAEEARKPHVIAVMVEAWSDLRVLGDIRTDVEVTPWLDEFMPTTIHGDAVSTVYGGNTATSEWEFLTGNSMAFMPAGSMVYRQFVRDDIRTIVDVMENNGYASLAMHPYYKNGWDRSRIYDLIGFDKMLFLEDADWGGQVREYVSDDAFVDMVIREFEARDPQKPLFVFGITMQNHGGYWIEDFEATVDVTAPVFDDATAEQYLSLIRLTDSALQRMIEYFEASDEEVVILAFGDHQPNLSQETDEALGYPTYLQKHTVPFFIWKNYEDESREVPLTSINYLPAMLLEEAGIELPPYFGLIRQAQQLVPSISGAGLTQGDAFVSIGEATPEQQEILQKYHIMQYANIFDSTVDDAPFAGAE